MLSKEMKRMIAGDIWSAWHAFSDHEAGMQAIRKWSSRDARTFGKGVLYAFDHYLSAPRSGYNR